MIAPSTYFGHIVSQNYSIQFCCSWGMNIIFSPSWVDGRSLSYSWLQSWYTSETRLFNTTYTRLLLGE